MSDTTVFSQPIAQEKAKLNTLVNNASDLIFEIKAVFPFDWFRDSIVVDKTKVNLIYRNFFFSKKIFPILIKDIRNVTIDTNPFFASLTFEIKGYELNPQTIKHLQRGQAFRAHNIIMGMVACDREGVDLTNLSKDEILQKVEQIGEPAT